MECKKISHQLTYPAFNAASWYDTSCSCIALFVVEADAELPEDGITPWAADQEPTPPFPDEGWPAYIM